MPSTMTTLQERRILDAVFGNAGLTSGSTVYFGLFISLPDDSGASGGEVSVTLTNYARVALANNSGSWANATSNSSFVTSKWNAVAINFAQCTGGNDFGQVIGLGMFDALAVGTGNLIWLADITPFRTIQNGDSASVPASSLTITLD